MIQNNTVEQCHENGKKKKNLLRNARPLDL